jgi:hypothetical protein
MGTPVMAASRVRSGDYEPLSRTCNCNANSLYMKIRSIHLSFGERIIVWSSNKELIIMG